MYSNAAARGCIRSPPVSTRPPLFRHRSRTTAGPLPATPRYPIATLPPHALPPHGTARGPSSTPRCVAYKGRPIAATPPFHSPLVLPHERVLEQIRRPLLSFLGLVSALDNWTTVAMSSLRRRAIVSPTSVSSTAPRCLILLDRASPPPSSPLATGLIDALRGH
jgi:hypothetical protein